MENRLRYKLKKINIPEEWFFCNPFKSFSEKILNNLTCKTGVIFFSEKPLKKKEFIKNIEPLVQIIIEEPEEEPIRSDPEIIYYKEKKSKVNPVFDEPDYTWDIL